MLSVRSILLPHPDEISAISQTCSENLVLRHCFELLIFVATIISMCTDHHIRNIWLTVFDSLACITASATSPGQAASGARLSTMGSRSLDSVRICLLCLSRTHSGQRSRSSCSGSSCCSWLSDSFVAVASVVPCPSHGQL
jgi:hypothetical protein